MPSEDTWLVMLLKGNTMMIGAIIALIIGSVIAASAKETITGLNDDKTMETYIAAMGLRNAIIQLSLTERGTAKYTMPQNEKYAVELGAETISIHYEGAVSKFRPLVELRHYTPQLEQKTLTGSEFCIVNLKDPDNDCKSIVRVCEKEEVGCCVLDTSVC